MTLPALASSTRAELEALTVRFGQPAFRAGQLLDWVYKRYELDPDRMLNLPLKLRTELKSGLVCRSTRLERADCAADRTEKLLISLADGEAVEMAVIPAPKRLTFCLSTQAGCPVGCRFCASGAGGLKRNLTAAEIIEQLYHGIGRAGRLPDNIVFMGIGEGLLNFSRLATALDRITEPDYIGMSPRRVTVSTSGYVPGIYQLIELGKPFNLAVSLHAVDDITRAALIPDRLRCPLAEIRRACDDYEREIGRMVTFEYVLLAGINDRPAAAEKLAAWARRHHAKVNLIPYNAAVGGFKRPAEVDILRFRDILKKNGARVTLRLEKGAKIAAACGQLRAWQEKKDDHDSN
ncbi:MAG: 23S rRNA (adenine(2503)-C(2))-methyltransferase RlmN [Victivallaceae bacterium]|nr:23S rRNA (adenine(2503)-C(2))-methyltransferase RlmN [Victivallaceae bacterium]